MNWMIEGLPETVTVNGAEIPIKSGFRAFLLIDRIMRDESLTAEDRLKESIDIFFNGNPPEDQDAASKAMIWFQHCGKEEESGKDKTGAPGKQMKRKTARALDLDRDSCYIYAAFLEAYGIDLTDRSTNLHWWKFMTLLECLPEDSRISRIMFYRTANLSGMSKGQRKHILEMRELYALDKGQKKTGNDENRKKLARRNRRMLDYVEARYRETGTGNRG